jgi:hypothetical protein
LDLDEAELVVEALELAEEAVDEAEGFIVGLLGHLQGDEAGLEVLALEGAALGGGPFYAVLGDSDLDIGAVGDFLEEVEQLANYVTVLAGGYGGKRKRSQYEGIPSFADLALAKEENTDRLSLTRSTSSCVFLSLALVGDSNREY